MLKEKERRSRNTLNDYYEILNIPINKP